MDPVEYVQLADWRRRVATTYARYRDESPAYPEQAAQTWRSARDELFRSHPQSPLPIDRRARFGGLSYFPYNADYRMTATVERLAEPAVAADSALLSLPASGDEPFSFCLLGRVTLSGPLAGATLPVFWIEGYAGGLFLPFRDTTAGKLTYGAGRYLLDSIKGADLGGNPDRTELTLDFNLAYHPSCAYDPQWNCPLAPPESRLAVPIPAGERLE